MNENQVAGERIKSYIERVERLTEEKKAITEDMKAVYDEAKGVGFDVKVLREMVKRRSMEKDALDEFECLLETYEKAVG